MSAEKRFFKVIDTRGGFERNIEATSEHEAIRMIRKEYPDVGRLIAVLCESVIAEPLEESMQNIWNKKEVIQ